MKPEAIQLFASQRAVKMTAILPPAEANTIGVIGEYELAKLCGYCPDFEIYAGGDGGKDNHIRLSYSIDVKASLKVSRNPDRGHLLHPVRFAHQTADIFTLLRVNDSPPHEWVGWEWGAKLLRSPIIDLGYGKSYAIPVGELRPIEELVERIARDA